MSSAAGTAGERVDRARQRAAMSQRALADATEIPQATLSRIISGQRPVHVPELIAISWATGVPLAALTGATSVASRVKCAARGGEGSDMGDLHDALVSFLELSDYLDEQAIPRCH